SLSPPSWPLSDAGSWPLLARAVGPTHSPCEQSAPVIEPESMATRSVPTCSVVSTRPVVPFLRSSVSPLAMEENDAEAAPPGGERLAPALAGEGERGAGRVDAAVQARERGHEGIGPDARHVGRGAATRVVDEERVAEVGGAVLVPRMGRVAQIDRGP